MIVNILDKIDTFMYYPVALVNIFRTAFIIFRQ